MNTDEMTLQRQGEGRNGINDAVRFYFQSKASHLDIESDDILDAAQTGKTNVLKFFW
jgi:hypothetical protein